MTHYGSHIVIESVTRKVNDERMVLFCHATSSGSASADIWRRGGSDLDRDQSRFGLGGGRPLCGTSRADGVDRIGALRREYFV